jgi:hypothetical protein
MGGQQKLRWLLKRQGVSWSIENAIKLDYGDCCTTLNILKAIDPL